jgi:hypothetical protein
VAGASADIGGEVGKGGAKIHALLSAEALRAMAAQAGSVSGPRYEYTSVANCPGAAPGVSGADLFCGQAVAACAGHSAAQGLGPSVVVLRRVVDAAGNPTGSGWQQVGVTCFPDLVPGRATLGMAQVLAAFHDTAFARAVAVIEPAGGRTLVNLATYVAVGWPAAGYRPGEVDHVDPARMLGYRVDIRPRLVSVVYRFGDGTAYGPTVSLGGPYPSGDVVTTYHVTGMVRVRVDVRYGGQFRVAGGPWLDIPDTVTVVGAPVPLEVAQASARLVTH